MDRGGTTTTVEMGTVEIVEGVEVRSSELFAQG
jgi:hypothetical protein